MNYKNGYKPFEKISTIVVQIKNDDFEAFGIRMNSGMEKFFNEASNKARNDCGRIARPSEWLVFLVSSSDMDILNIQKCHSNVFKSFSDEVWDSYRTLGLSSNSLIEYLIYYTANVTVVLFLVFSCVSIPDVPKWYLLLLIVISI